MSEQQKTLNIQQSLESALQNHKAGHLPEAETTYQQILQEEPDQPVALHLLGVVAHQVGKNDIAVDLISRAVAVKPDYAEAHNDLGNALRVLGNLDEARSSYRKAVHLKPDLAEAHYNLGVVLRDLGELADAVSSFREALTINPNYVDAHSNLGLTLHSLDKPEEAVLSFRKALVLNPDFAEMHNYLGVALRNLGELEDAVASYQKALTIAPDNAGAHNNLGLALFELGRPEEAIASYHKALTIMPDLVEAHYNLGNVLWRLGKLEKAQTTYDEAVRLKPDYAEAHYKLGTLLWILGKVEKAETHFRRTLSLKPDYADAHNNLGNALWVLGKEEEAEANFRKAITINPNFAEAHNNLGALHHAHRKFEEAVASLRKALDLNPEYAEAHANLGLALQDQGKIDEAAKQIDLALSHKPEQDGWRIRKALLLPAIPYSKQDTQVRRDTLAKAVKDLTKQNLFVSDPVFEVGTTNFYLAYHDQRNNKRLMEDIAKLYIAACPKLTYEAKHCRTKQRSGKDVLRIGFLSSYFQSHTIGKFTRGIIQYLSRDHFEVILFRPAGKPDSISNVIDQSADKVVRLSGKLEKDQKRIEYETLDILFYPDIGMSPLTYFLAFSRLAPVQVTTWGHPDTTGIPNMDYFLSSKLSEIATSEEHYSEQLITLKYWAPYYFRPDPPKNKYTPSDYGLPHGQRFYVCPQTLFKFHPAFDDILGELLRRDPKGRLVLIDDGKNRSSRKLLVERFFRSFPDVAKNVIFVPKMAHEKLLGLFMVADAVLDIPTFSGGNTSLEAFAMGAPIVTWPQDFVRGRLTAGLYKQMGLSDLIATDANSYLKLALQLALDIDFKRQMQDDIKANAYKLYERFEAIEEMEAFFIKAYQAWQAKTALTDPTHR